MTAPAEVLELERAALRAWPAAEVESFDGWILRAMDGVTRRANSAWTSETHGARTLGERIARVEAFYRERAQPSTFMLTPLSPPGLDAELERRGYVVDAPVSIQTARVEPTASSPEVHLSHEPSAAFLAVVVEHGRYARSAPTFHGLLARLGAAATYASVTLDGTPSAAGLGVKDGEWFGIFAMRTREGARRRGLAQTILRALTTTAHELGARILYLQVERDNPAALALYARAGFREAYGYHYRVQPGGSSEGC